MFSTLAPVWSVNLFNLSSHRKERKVQMYVCFVLKLDQLQLLRSILLHVTKTLTCFIYKYRSVTKLGDNCIQIFHLGRYIVGYTVGNFVLRRRVSGAVKHDFRPYIRRYTSPNENFEYGYPHSMHSNVLFNFYTSKTLYFVQNVSFISDINHYVDHSLATLLLTLGFRQVYRKIYCRKFLMLSNQTSRYIHRCIRMQVSQLI